MTSSHGDYLGKSHHKQQFPIIGYRNDISRTVIRVAGDDEDLKIAKASAVVLRTSRKMEVERVLCLSPLEERI